MVGSGPRPPRRGADCLHHGFPVQAAVVVVVSRRDGEEAVELGA